MYLRQKGDFLLLNLEGAGLDNAERERVLETIRNSRLPLRVSLNGQRTPSSRDLILLGDVLHAVRSRGGRIQIHSGSEVSASPALAALLHRAESLLASA